MTESDSGVYWKYDSTNVLLRLAISPSTNLIPSLFSRPSDQGPHGISTETTKKGANKVILPLTYTPDFKFDAQGTTVYLEAKGFENDVFPVKRKLFLSWIERQEKPILFAEIKTLRGLNRLIERLKQL